MNEVTRYRLIGGVFLLALAAIFLPMIFDAPGPSLQEIAAARPSVIRCQTRIKTHPRKSPIRVHDVDAMIAEMQQQQAT